MQQDIPQKYSKVFSKNIESNGRFSGCYHFVIEGDFGKRAESSIYYKIGLDINEALTGFEAGDTIIFSIKNEFDFWKRAELKAYSSNYNELFCFRWIMGNEVLRRGIFKESCLSEDGKIEATALAKIKELDILPKEKRTIVIFDKICRTGVSYGKRPLISTLLNELESILTNRFLERKYATPFFIINLERVVRTSYCSATTLQSISHIRDFYIKHGYSYCHSSSDERNFLKKDLTISLECECERDDEDIESYRMQNICEELGTSDNFFSEITERIESNIGIPKKNEPAPSNKPCELFEWGDTIEIVDNGRDFLCSVISNDERNLLKVGMRGLVLHDEKKDDCGMITCGFKEFKSLYNKIHYTNLRRVSKFN